MFLFFFFSLSLLIPKARFFHFIGVPLPIAFSWWIVLAVGRTGKKKQKKLELYRKRFLRRTEGKSGIGRRKGGEDGDGLAGVVRLLRSKRPAGHGGSGPPSLPFFYDRGGQSQDWTRFQQYNDNTNNDAGTRERRKLACFAGCDRSTITTRQAKQVERGMLYQSWSIFVVLFYFIYLGLDGVVYRCLPTNQIIESGCLPGCRLSSVYPFPPSR